MVEQIVGFLEQFAFGTKKEFPYFVFVFFDKKYNEKSGLFIDDLGWHGKGINSIVVCSFVNTKAYSDV